MNDIKSFLQDGLPLERFTRTQREAFQACDIRTGKDLLLVPLIELRRRPYIGDGSIKKMNEVLREIHPQLEVGMLDGVSKTEHGTPFYIKHNGERDVSPSAFVAYLDVDNGAEPLTPNA